MLASELILVNELIIEHARTWSKGSLHTMDNYNILKKLTF